MERFKCCQIGRFLKASLFLQGNKSTLRCKSPGAFCPQRCKQIAPTFARLFAVRGKHMFLSSFAYWPQRSPREGQSHLEVYLPWGRSGSPWTKERRLTFARPQVYDCKSQQQAVWQPGPQSAFYFIYMWHTTFGECRFFMCFDKRRTLRRRGETTHATQGSIKNDEEINCTASFWELHSFKPMVFSFEINKWLHKKSIIKVQILLIIKFCELFSYKFRNFHYTRHHL